MVVREMPCAHFFHEDCLFKWLSCSNTCPTCRYPLDTDNADYNRVVSELLAQRRESSQRESVAGQKRSRSSSGAEDDVVEVEDIRTPKRRRTQKAFACIEGNATANAQQCGQKSDCRALVCFENCKHSFHKPCLKGALLINGHSNFAKPGSAPCPVCLTSSVIPALDSSSASTSSTA
jgi:hypothetical protein